MLIRAGHDRARDMGHDYSVVSGDRSALLRTVGLRKTPATTELFRRSTCRPNIICAAVCGRRPRRSPGPFDMPGNSSDRS